MGGSTVVLDGLPSRKRVGLSQETQKGILSFPRVCRDCLLVGPPDLIFYDSNCAPGAQCLPMSLGAGSRAFITVPGEPLFMSCFLFRRWSIKSCSSPGSSLHALMAWLKGWEHRLTWESSLSVISASDRVAWNPKMPHPLWHSPHLWMTQLRDIFAHLVLPVALSYHTWFLWLQVGEKEKELSSLEHPPSCFQASGPHHRWCALKQQQGLPDHWGNGMLCVILGNGGALGQCAFLEGTRVMWGLEHWVQWMIWFWDSAVTEPWTGTGLVKCCLKTLLGTSALEQP